MDRKLKVMGIYIGLLFFVSILLILVTSFSGNKMEPSYEVEDVQEERQVTFDRTMEQSVNTITETNRQLTEEVEELTSQLEEKNKIIEEYNSKYNEDAINLQNAIKSYINGDFEKSKESLDSIKKENLSEDDIQVYNNLINKLN